MKGFTLVELLIVITIIVVLLALLTPALDRAVYEAELTVCGARLKAASTGVLQYAVENKRTYPDRQNPRDQAIDSTPDQLCSLYHDDRATIFKAIQPKMLIDPFCVPVDIENDPQGTQIYVNYEMWFAWRFNSGTTEAGVTTAADSGEHGMYRIGDRFTWEGKPFHVLITDNDRLIAGSAQASHPDHDGVLVHEGPYQGVVNPWPGWNLGGPYATYFTWAIHNRTDRGALDMNYAYDDGSVTRLYDVQVSDARPSLGRVPDTARSTGDQFGRQIAK